MKNTNAERERLSKINAENENTNFRIKAILLELANDATVENVRPYSPSQQELLKIYEEGVLRSNVDIPDDIGKISKLSQPSKSDVIRYKAWLEQHYRSPYTNKMIPLNKLFTLAYEIEHVIPQSRYFDDSFSNKVICESEINKFKDNQLGFELIKNHGGQKVTLVNGETAEILKTAAYENFVKTRYKNNPTKKKKLLMEDIPEQFIERQINDTRYISKLVMGLLSNIVREEDETEARAKKVIPCTGGVTARLKQDWGLNDVWNDIITPRFIRLNEMTKTQFFGKINPNTKKFLPEVPLEQQKGFSKKRIDHRHHALDALVIACATTNHVNYLNNESHIRKGKNKEEKQKIRFDLRNNLCYKTKPDENGNYKWMFYKPWDTITQETRKALQSSVVSFKQNLRVINKTANRHQKWVKQTDGSIKKELVNQMGKNWSIRKPLHKETIYGKVTIKTDRGKTATINKVLENPGMIIDHNIRKIVITRYKELNKDIAKLKKYFKANPIHINDQKVERVHIYEWVEGTASRVELDTSFTKAKIEKSVTDSGIQKILIRHLEQEKYQNQMDEKGKIIPPEELAFSPEGKKDMNKNIRELNNEKFHQPFYKVRIYEAGSRFAVGETGNKKSKYVEAAKGTNLFFAIYEHENGNRNYETVPFNEVIAHQQQIAHLPEEERTPIPVNNEKGRFLFALSPNNLVYVPTEEEIDNTGLVDFNNLIKEQVERIYKMVSCTGNQCMFIRNDIATTIINKYEFSPLNKMERAITKEENMIKEICWKLQINRLGKIINVIR
ncbi:CRISPR-associated endonuclease Cas9 [subsurface metagenome]